jgi:hypothetical protein
MLEIILAASIQCITIADYGPLLNTSVAEITQVWPRQYDGNSFIWDFKDGTRWFVSFAKDGCVVSKVTISDKAADEIVRLLGGGI